MSPMLNLPSFSAIHKGSHGRIAIVGGSEHYTGAPFFSGISSLRTGADLVSILTHPNALIPIKCYGPDLMVSDYNDVEKFKSVMDKAHSVVLGPGLAKYEKTSEIFDQIKLKADIPVVIDADGLAFYKPGMFKKVILTPNAKEYKNLNPRNLSGMELAKQLQAVILLKGDNDRIISYDTIKVVDEKTTPRRCGGQGDILAGILATFAAWNPDDLENAAVHASKLLRRSALLCYTNSQGRSMISSEIPNFIGQAFNSLFPNDGKS
eukprot:NODE_371_length_9954_cov_0.100355.p4 type:complete len:264 gc:universal NODE_371_length_9954_cov_0.100355:289-1080(+)